MRLRSGSAFRNPQPRGTKGHASIHYFARPGDAFVWARREVVAMLRRSLEGGGTGAQGYSRDECVKAVNLAEKALAALDSGNPALIFKRAWLAGQWFSNAKTAIHATIGRASNEGAKRGGKARRISASEKLKRLEAWERKLELRKLIHPNEKTGRAMDRLRIPKTTFYEYRKFRNR